MAGKAQFLYSISNGVLAVRSAEPTTTLSDGLILENFAKALAGYDNAEVTYTNFIPRDKGFMTHTPRCQTFTQSTDLQSRDNPSCEMIIVKINLFYPKAPSQINMTDVENLLITMANTLPTVTLEKTGPEAFNCYIFDKTSFNRQHPNRAGSDLLGDGDNKHSMRDFLRSTNLILHQYKYVRDSSAPLLPNGRSQTTFPGFRFPH